jgi:transcriptional regulator with XRE-family HTH domain
MSSDTLVKLALNSLGCSQKELAKKLGVSPSQISKWKSTEYMSLEMQDRLKEIANIEGYEPDFIYWVGGIEQARQWEKLIKEIAQYALLSCETGYVTDFLETDDELLRGMLCRHTISILRDLGMTIPQVFPEELLLDDSYFNHEKQNHLYDLIRDGYEAFNNVYGFFYAHIAPIVFEFEISDDPAHLDGVEIGYLGRQMESELLDLAFSMVAEESILTPNVRSFQHKTNRTFVEYITKIKQYAFHKSIPLKVELSDLLSGNTESLRESAEISSMGLTLDQLHPDIYMNEIIYNLRFMRQVLPSICKKLGITDLELKEQK